MSIVPAPIEKTVRNIDPAKARKYGIGCALVAVLSAIRLVVGVYNTVAYGIDVFLIFQIVVWAVLGVVTGIYAVAYLERARQP